MKKTILITESQFENLVNTLLNEDDRDNRINKLKKIFPKIKDKEFNKIIEADPTKILEFLPWLLRQYNNILKHEIKNIKPDVFLEDLPKIKDYLTIYKKIRFNIEIDPLYRNINYLKTYNELYDLIKPHKESKLMGIEQRELDELLKTNAAKKIFESNKWIILWPKTELASCIIGRNSEWCTTYGPGGTHPEKSENAFKSHIIHGNFNYILNKSNPKEKYAFYFNNEPMDIEVYDIDDKKVYTLETIDSFFKNKKELLKPLIESGKLFHHWKFLLKTGVISWVSFVDPNILNLNLHGLGLTRLPDDIGRLTNMTIFSVGNNNLTSLPESVGNLKNLTAISAPYNNLRALPESIGNLKKLTDVMINHNEFTEIPPVLSKVTKLRSLYLSENKNIKKISEQIKRFPNFKNLRFLTLKQMNVSDIELKKIRELLPNTSVIN